MTSINKYLNFSNTRQLVTVHQSEISECGLACLVMIAGYYGHKIDLTTARSKFNVSQKGLNLKALADIAAAMELQARPIKAELEALPIIKTPAILHWNLCHYVVLEKIKGKMAVIHDPGRGKTAMSIDELSNHYTGIALEIIPSPAFEEKDETRPVKLSNFWGKLVWLKSMLIKIFALSLFLQLFVITAPLFQQLIVDDAITKQDSNLLFVLAIGLVLIGVFQTLITYIRSKILLYFTNTLTLQMTANLFRHLIRLPLPYFEKRQIGDITMRFGSLAPIQTLITSGVIAVLLDGLMAIASLTMSLIYSPILTLVAILFLIANLAIQMVIFPYLKRENEKIIELSGKESTAFLENIQNAVTIKIFGQETIRENIWLNKKADQMNANISLANFNISLGAFLSIFTSLQAVILMYLGAMLVIDGSFTLGMLFAFQAYSSQFTGKVSAIISQYMSFKMLDLHLSRLADIVHEEQESVGKGHIYLSNNTFQEELIRFENVSFRYADSEPWVLRNINFTVKRGDMIAIVGPSGGGKSTLLKLMLGLIKPSEGSIYIDNIDIAMIDASSYRKQLGVVMQNDKLLSGTIADNISFFDPEMNLEKVSYSAKMSEIDHEIIKAPMSYNTIIGEMGNSLSGGQKQRIFLARALYKDPSILFLDEGTANLDQETEYKVSCTIKNLPITRVIIAHRPALIEISDRIFQINNGILVETHA